MPALRCVQGAPHVVVDGLREGCLQAGINQGAAADSKGRYSAEQRAGSGQGASGGGGEGGEGLGSSSAGTPECSRSHLQAQLEVMECQGQQRAVLEAAVTSSICHPNVVSGLGLVPGWRGAVAAPTCRARQGPDAQPEQGGMSCSRVCFCWKHNHAPTRH